MHFSDVVVASACRPFASAIDKKIHDRDIGNFWQILTYVTNPLDDGIRAAAVVALATHTHFNDIQDCLSSDKPSKKIEGVFKILATPVWFPVKLAAKTLLFAVPFLMLGGASLLLPVRTIISLWDRSAIFERGAEQHVARFLLNLERNNINCPEPLFNRHALNYARVGIMPFAADKDTPLLDPVLGDNVFGEVVDLVARKLLY